MKQLYTHKEIENEIELLKNTFDIVRLVNPVTGGVMKPEGHNPFAPSGCFCFEAWNKNQRCKNCISALAFSRHDKQTKLEHIGNTLYCIISRYVVVDGYELVLETVKSFNPEYTEKILSEDGQAVELIRLYRQISIDDLTGLYNRRFCRENLPVLLIKAKSENSYLGILFIDIDNFKQINDKYGHIAGDSTLAAIASSLHAVISENSNDFVARFGGDEFVAVITDTDFNKLEIVCQKILRAVSRTAILDYPFIKPSVTIGGTLSSENVSYEKMMSIADKNLYRAKNSGKGTYRLK